MNHQQKQPSDSSELNQAICHVINAGSIAAKLKGGLAASRAARTARLCRPVRHSGSAPFERVSSCPFSRLCPTHSHNAFDMFRIPPPDQLIDWSTTEAQPGCEDVDAGRPQDERSARMRVRGRLKLACMPETDAHGQSS